MSTTLPASGDGACPTAMTGQKRRLSNFLERWKSTDTNDEEGSPRLLLKMGRFLADASCLRFYLSGNEPGYADFEADYP